MKRNRIVVTTAIALLMVTFLTNVAESSFQAPYNIPTLGKISVNGEIQTNPNSEIIIRGLCMGPPGDGSSSAIRSWVDNFVANNSYANSVTLSDFHPYGVLWFGYTFSQSQGTWMGWTFSQLKNMIDEFHEKNWKVGLETTAIAWQGQQEYNYITQLHPELAFTDASGNSAAVTKNGTNNIIPDWFAVYKTADAINNIPAGSVLIDVYTTRLTQMIQAGLSWDFWYGTDGWNGLNLEGYSWHTSIASNCYSFSVEEENQYGNWSGASLPSNWASLDQVGRANAILSNPTTLNTWWQYWQMRFAQMYAEIKQAFLNAGQSANTFHVLGTIDTSTVDPNLGNNAPNGMYNLTNLVNYNAVDYFESSQESNVFFDTHTAYSVGKDNALVDAYARLLGARVMIGLELSDYSEPIPLWSVEQSYLQQSINYVWINGERYSVANPNAIFINGIAISTDGTAYYPGWTSAQLDQLFNFIASVSTILYGTYPVWLGPTYLQPDQKSGSVGYAVQGFNYSFAQWGLVDNVQSNPSYIQSSMNTLLLDVGAYGDLDNKLTGLSNYIVNNLFANGDLNLYIYSQNGLTSQIADSVFNDNSEQQIEAALGIQWQPTYGGPYPAAASYTFLSDATIADPIGQNLVFGYENQVVSTDLNKNIYSNYKSAPSVVNVTIGDSSNWDSWLSISPGTMTGSMFQSSYDGNITALNVLTQGSCPSQTAIYDATTGALLGTATGNSVSNDWSRFVFSSPIKVSTNHEYWFVFQSSSNNAVMSYTVGAINQTMSSSNTYGKFPSAISPNSYSNIELAMYASVTATTASMTPLAIYPSQGNNIAIGTVTNSNGGKAVLQEGAYYQYIITPREISNRLLYWDSNAPVVPSESLVDLKVYRNSSTIYIPMTDQLNIGQSFDIDPISFTLNASLLASQQGLGNINNYQFSWLSNPSNSWTESDWSNIGTLTFNGADVLIISAK